jgi:hypothetical protein
VEGGRRRVLPSELRPLESIKTIRIRIRSFMKSFLIILHRKLPTRNPDPTALVLVDMQGAPAQAAAGQQQDSRREGSEGGATTDRRRRDVNATRSWAYAEYVVPTWFLTP